MKKILTTLVLTSASFCASLEEPEFKSTEAPTFKPEQTGYGYCRLGAVLIVPGIAGVGYRSNSGHHNYDVSISTMGARLGYNYYFTAEPTLGERRTYIGSGVRIMGNVVPLPDFQIGWEKKKESSYSFFEVGFDVASTLVVSTVAEFPVPIVTFSWGFSF